MRLKNRSRRRSLRSQYQATLELLEAYGSYGFME